MSYVLYCNYEIYIFFIFSRNYLISLKKITPHNAISFWNQSFLTLYNRCFSKFLPPLHFEGRGACHEVTSLVSSLTSSKSSGSECLTAEFYKHLYQKNYFSKFCGSHSNQKIHRSRLQSFLILSNLASFLYFVPNILSRIVDVHYSREELFTIRVCSKTNIISLICKKRDKNNYISKSQAKKL